MLMKSFHTHTAWLWEYSSLTPPAPQSEQPSINSLLSAASDTNSDVISWLHVISAVQPPSPPSPSTPLLLLKYNAFKSHRLYFFPLYFVLHLQPRRRLCLFCPSWLKASGSFFPDIIPTIDQTLFTLTQLLSPPAIRRQPSTSCPPHTGFIHLFFP